MRIFELLAGILVAILMIPLLMVAMLLSLAELPRYLREKNM